MTHPGRMMLLCGAASLALAVAGCKKEEQKAEAPRPVRTVIAKPAVIGDEVSVTGEIQPHIETDLGFKIAGRVATRTAEVGVTVRKGQLLATLDPKDVRNEIRSAEADLRSAEASEALAKQALDRQRTLFEKDVVARARVEEVEAQWRTANARTKSAQAALEIAGNKLADTELRAPDDGIVTLIAINSGQVVNAGQPAIKLASIREPDAVFNISERLYTTTPDDARIEVALLSNPAIKVAGRFRDASPAADPVTRTYRVRIALPNAPQEMTLGATVTGSISSTGKPLIVLPASAITSDDGKPAVYVLQPSTQLLARKPIVVARYTTEQVLVSSGLEDGAIVVTAGVSKLRPGQKVAYSAGSSGSGEAAK